MFISIVAAFNRLDLGYLSVGSGQAVVCGDGAAKDRESRHDVRRGIHGAEQELRQSSAGSVSILEKDRIC